MYKRKKKLWLTCRVASLCRIRNIIESPKTNKNKWNKYLETFYYILKGESFMRTVEKTRVVSFKFKHRYLRSRSDSGTAYSVYFREMRFNGLWPCISFRSKVLVYSEIVIVVEYMQPEQEPFLHNITVYERSEIIF